MSEINKIDIKQLRIIQGLLQERNLSRVAAQMGLTQQAISEQLRKLRIIFNDHLFVRSSNGVVPTSLAEEMEDKINTILNEVEGLFSDKNFSAEKLSGTFIISATDYAVKAVLPSLTSAIRSAAPNLKLIIRDFESDNLYNLLASSEIDLALTFSAFVPDKCHSLLLFREQHICVASRHSPLIAQPLQLSDIASQPQLIVSPSRANLKGSHDSWFAQQGLKRNIVMSVPSFAAAADIVEQSDTIAFLPSRLLPNEKVAPLQLDITPPSFEVIAAWHSRSNHSPVHKWIIGLLKSQFHDC